MESAAHAYQRIVMSNELQAKAQQLYQKLREEAAEHGMNYEDVSGSTVKNLKICICRTT